MRRTVLRPHVQREAVSTDVRGDLPRQVLVEVADVHVSTFGGEGFCRCCADAPGTAGDGDRGTIESNRGHRLTGDLAAQ